MLGRKAGTIVSNGMVTSAVTWESRSHGDGLHVTVHVPEAHVIPAAWSTWSMRALPTLAADAGVALAWLVDRPTVSSVILGARTVEQLEDNLGAAGLHLSEEHTRRLDEASDPAPADYPYGHHGTQAQQRRLDGFR